MKDLASVLLDNFPVQSVGRPAVESYSDVYSKSVILMLFADFTTNVVTICEDILKSQRNLQLNLSDDTVLCRLSVMRTTFRDMSKKSVSQKCKMLSATKSFSDYCYYELVSPYGAIIT